VSADASPPGSVEIRTEEGLALAGHPELLDALRDAARAAALVLDGYLLDLPPLEAPGAYSGTSAAAVPGLAGATRQLVLGQRSGQADQPATGRSRPVTRPPNSSSGPIDMPRSAAPMAAFVAVDLLAIDADTLFDVPLAERKRLLEAVLQAGERVRRGPHLRPPAEGWYGQWRAYGFGEMAVKAANSRYLPGLPSDDWAVAPIPRG
jgi:hypothetical protein